MSTAKRRSPQAAARRTVIAHLREIKGTMTNLTSWWNVSATAYVAPADSGPRNATLRDRHPEEYPEAQARYWASTVAEVDKMVEELGRLRKFAVAEFHRCEER